MSGRKIISLEHIKVACKNCSLSTLCLPMGLTPEDVERLDSIVERNRPLHRGDILFHEGDRFRSLYVVKTGAVKTLSTEEAGGEKVLGFHLPGEIIGLDAIQGERHRCTGKVLETSAICELPFRNLEQLSLKIPSLQHQLFRLLSKEISQENEMLLLLGKRNAEERLASFLLSLSERYRRRGLSATEFYLSMSRFEIGSYLGLAVETISRLFTRMQDERLLRVERKHVKLLDLKRLHSIACGQAGDPRSRHCP